jgi:hypothetical protein
VSSSANSDGGKYNSGGGKSTTLTHGKITTKRLSGKRLPASWVDGRLLFATWNGGKTHVAFSTSRYTNFDNNFWKGLFLIIMLDRGLYL